MNSLDKMANEITDNMNKLITLLEIDKLIKIEEVIVTNFHLNNCKVRFILEKGILTEIEVNRINIVLNVMGLSLHKLRNFTLMEKRGPNQYWIDRVVMLSFCNSQDFDQINDLLKLTVDSMELIYYHLKHN